MNEAQWRACTDPDDLLEFLRDQGSDRKFRLFMCACCRRFLTLLPRKPVHDLRLCEKYVSYGEKLADGLVVWEEVDAAFDEMDLANVSHDGYLAAIAARQAIYREVAGCSRPMLRGRNLIAHPASTASGYARTVMGRAQSNNKAAKGSTPTAKKRMATIAEKRYQIQLLHDIFGNPFAPVAPDRSWTTATVKAVARQMYDTSDFSSMPILADALEDAGCDDADALAHCRSGGEHVRGCWIVDLILGKS